MACLAGVRRLMPKRVQISTKQELDSAISLDREANLGHKSINLEKRFRAGFPVQLVRYLKFLRLYEYACFQRDNASSYFLKKIYALKVRWYDRRKNLLGTCIAVEVAPFRMKPGVRICHGGVIINGFVSQGCVFHGHNVLGNKRSGEADAVPSLGANVDMGAGAIAIGKINIADNCIVGAAALVTKNFNEPGSIIIGVPGRIAQAKLPDL